MTNIKKIQEKSELIECTHKPFINKKKMTKKQGSKENKQNSADFEKTVKRLQNANQVFFSYFNNDKGTFKNIKNVRAKKYGAY